MKKSEWKIRADAGSAEVFVYGEIGFDIVAKEFVDQLNALPQSVAEVSVRINSPGGSVFDAVAMYQALLRHPARIIVSVDALAASGASVVAMGGDHITIADGAMMMIHDAAVVIAGTAIDLREMADLLDKINESLVRAYARRPGVEEAAIRAAMDAETWYSAQEAVDAGLADEVGAETLAVAAKLDPARYRWVPPNLRAGRPPHAQPARPLLAAAEKTLTLLDI